MYLNTHIEVKSLSLQKGKNVCTLVNELTGVCLKNLWQSKIEMENLLRDDR